MTSRVNVRTDLDTSWMPFGSCAGQDQAIFYPHDAAGVAKAKEICDGCPVKVRCGQYALEAEEPYGVWGSLSERQRERILGKRRAEKGAA